LGPPDDTNPFWLAPTDSIRRVLGGPLVLGAQLDSSDASLVALDASLDVPGTPQSATGQVSLFTGINVARRLGYHLPAFPNGPLKEIVRTHSILKRATDEGYCATFANAYSPLYFEMVEKTNRPMSATTHAVLGADLPFRWISDLEAGRAVYWDLTNEHLVERYGLSLPIITPEEAGRNLAGISREQDLVLYESFLTDVAGHSKSLAESVQVLERLDRFLGSLWDHVPADATTVICSDHGNVEDVKRGIHTLNPVPLLVTGPGASAFREARSITDVADPILRVLRGTTDVSS
jgi:hypothetical protein